MREAPDANEADAAAAPLSVYDRVAWVAYAVMFLVIPLMVLIFRTHMETWHYYLAAGLILAGAVLIEAMNVAHTDKQIETEQSTAR